MQKHLKKILHIDDDAVMRLMTKKALERSGQNFSIISCACGSDFLNEIEPFNPDLLLVDLVMPIMDGETLISHLRKTEYKTRNTPTIFITGKPDISFKDRTALEPVIGIIQKPFVAATIGTDIMRLWNSYR